MRYIFYIVSDNKPGVLYRITNLLYKRKINIESIYANEGKNNLSNCELTIQTDAQTAKLLAKQFERIIEVHKVTFE